MENSRVYSFLWSKSRQQIMLKNYFFRCIFYQPYICSRHLVKCFWQRERVVSKIVHFDTSFSLTRKYVMIIKLLKMASSFGSRGFKKQQENILKALSLSGEYSYEKKIELTYAFFKNVKIKPYFLWLKTLLAFTFHNFFFLLQM